MTDEITQQQDSVLDNLRSQPHGWQMSAGQLKLAMGCAKEWPDAGLLPQFVGNTRVYVMPRNAFGRRKHRAFAICADCGRQVPAGRLHQHRKVHK